MNFSYFNSDSKSYTVGFYKGKEDVYVDNVKLCGTFTGQSNVKSKAVIILRVPVSDWFLISLTIIFGLINIK